MKQTVVFFSQTPVFAGKTLFLLLEALQKQVIIFQIA